MRTFRWMEPAEDMSPVTGYITDYEIILLHWMEWSALVFKNRPDNTFKITPDECVEDFCVVNWCTETWR